MLYFTAVCTSHEAARQCPADAPQTATAIPAQATGLITNDPIFLRVVEFETLVLDQFF